jgi:NhaP-type Na+/H+ or K+/H+ antiporter
MLFDQEGPGLLPWFLLVGAVLIVIGLSGRLVQRLPLSPAIVYLAVGFLIGPAGIELLDIHPVDDAALLEVLAEVAVLITLFAVGLQVRLPLGSASWNVPVRLAGTGMVVMTALSAMAAWAVLGLPFAAALLLAAVLAPTDPVLASDVQVESPTDRDAVRLSITVEGGLNDGTAFPAVMLALGLLGVHELGAFGWRWLAVDVLWAVAGGLALGWACGTGMARLVARLRAGGAAPEQEELLAFGVIALTYGLALLLLTYGFVAVFVAGVALAHHERRLREGRASGPAPSERDDASHSMRLRRFAGQCESLAEVAIVLVIGAALGAVAWRWELLLFAAAMLLVVRPLTVLLVVPRRLLSASQRRLVAWFGIRGVGTVYYLSFAIHRGVPNGAAELVAEAAYVTIALSIVMHGISATPLMERYRLRRRR